VEREVIDWPWQYSPFDGDGVVRGELVSLDGTSTTRFTKSDVKEIVVKKLSGNQWDGAATFVLRLADDRLAAFALRYEDGYGNDFLHHEGDAVASGGVVYLARAIQPLRERLGLA
jgi:hypothetical protein